MIRAFLKSKKNLLSVKYFILKRDYASSNQESKTKLLSYIFIGGVGTILGAGFVYKNYKSEKIEESIDKIRKTPQHFGTPLIGGEFDLIDHNGKTKSIKDFRGKWLLIYFGFCNCPDVCPDQLEKMVMVVERLAMTKGVPPIHPLFVSIDPERDSPPIMKEYLKEFSDKILGLTGNLDNVKKISKAYRVYYSKGPTDKFGDYIVDHAIIMYLVGPEGEFMGYFGQNKSVPEMSKEMKMLIDSYDPELQAKRAAKSQIDSLTLIPALSTFSAYVWEYVTQYTFCTISLFPRSSTKSQNKFLNASLSGKYPNQLLNAV